MTRNKKAKLLAFAVATLIVTAGVGLYFRFFFSGHLKDFIVTRIADATGNTFVIGDLDIRLVEPVIKLSDIVLPLPLVGPVRIDNVTFHFSRRGLFRRKFFVTDVGIQGLEALGPAEVATTLDRIVPERDSPLRLATPTSNPLRQVASVDTGMNLQSKFNQAVPRLNSTLRIKELKKEIAAKRELWLTMADRAFTTSDLKQGTETWAQIEREGEALESQFRSLRAGLDAEGLKIRESLDLPSLATQDLSTLLFESKIVGLLDRIAWPLTWARTHLRSESRKTKVLPRFLLARTEPSTDSTTQARGGRLSALMETLSTEPRFFAQPMHVALTVSFPSLGIDQMKADVEMDYFSPIPSEKVMASIASFPIREWQLSHGHLDLKMLSGKASTSLDLLWKGDQVQGNWQLKISNAKFEIRSGQREFEDAVTQRVETLSQFAVTGTISGTAQRLILTAESPLGRLLADALVATYRTPLAAVDDALQRIVLDEFDPEISLLEGRYRKLKQTAFHRLQGLQGKKLKKSRDLAEEK